MSQLSAARLFRAGGNGVRGTHFDGRVSAGAMAAGDPLAALAPHSDSAASLGVGGTVEATFPNNQTETLTVVAVYEDAAVYGNWVIDGALWDRHFNRNDLAFASSRIARLPGADEASQGAALEASRVAVDGVIDRCPTVKVEKHRPSSARRRSRSSRASSG